MPSKNFHVRQAAVSALRAWAKGHDYAESLVERHAQRRMLSSADRALLQAILFGVLRHRRVLDHWIGKLRHGKLDADTRDILRVGLCQILILNIPDHAAVNETVEAGKTSVRPLINAVLRKAISSRKRLMEAVASVSSSPCTAGKAGRRKRRSYSMISVRRSSRSSMASFPSWWCRMSRRSSGGRWPPRISASVTTA